MSAQSDFYLAQAADSARAAEQATLENVRQRCLRAETAWRAMAARALFVEGHRARSASAARPPHGGGA